MDNTQTDVQTCGSPAVPPTQAPEAICSIRLSERDEAQLMAASEKPPVPNEAALKAAKRFLQRHG